MRRVTGSYAARSSTVATCSPALKAQRADSDEHLLVFARLPEPGKTKTRLIPAWGADGAAAIYKLLAQQTMETSRQFAASRGCSLTVCFSGGAVQAMEEAFGSDQKYATQVGSDLGDKLTHAVEGAFAAGARRVVVIGTDCLELEPADLHAAFDSLASHQVVLGPATDGGYYLIGMSRFQPLLFHDIDWGSESVFSQTKAIAQQCGVDLAELRPHSDIDHPEDLLPVRGRPDLATRAPFDNVAGRISVVIPTLNEAEQLPGTLQALSQPDDRPDGHLEVIVVDGGSNDRTLEIAAEHGCKAFLGNRGRARQMNAGASVATGEYLLFLHADTRLPADYRNSIRSCLASGSIAGAFRLGIAGDSAGLRWVEWGANARSRLRQLPYGDQGIFLRSSTFFELAGYRSLPIMEDYEFVQRLRGRGSIELLEQAVSTSGRRWKERGIWTTTLLNQFCILGYKMGCAPATLAKLYRSVK